jgi:hypothetical protein
MSGEDTHSHFTHTPSASPIALSTLTTTSHRAAPPPPYIPPPPSNPRVFLVRGFSSLGGGRSAHPPNSKPYVKSPTNLSDSPPAELDACSPPPRAQDTPSAGSCHEWPYPLRHQQHSHAARTDPMPRWTSGRECPLGAAAEGDVDYRTHNRLLILTPSPSTHPTTPSHHTRTHSTGLPPPGGQALLDHGISQPHLIS